MVDRWNMCVLGLVRSFLLGQIEHINAQLQPPAPLSWHGRVGEIGGFVMASALGILANVCGGYDG
jgi:hypothetical protein